MTSSYQTPFCVSCVGFYVRKRDKMALDHYFDELVLTYEPSKALLFANEARALYFCEAATKHFGKRGPWLVVKRFYGQHLDYSVFEPQKKE